MSDPIKDLEEFPTMPTTPLPAHQVRRRGDQMRRRRQVLSAVGGVAAVAMIAGLGTFFVGGGADRAVDPIATDPTPTETVQRVLGPVTTANLLPTDETLFVDQAWDEDETFAGDGQATISPCQEESFAGLGAESVQQRTWGLEGTHHLQQAVSSYSSPAAAQRAFEAWREWLVSCPDEFVGDYTPRTIETGVDADQQLLIDATWRDPSTEEGGEAYAEHRTFTALVRVDDRLSVLYQDSPDGSDDAYGWQVLPVEAMLPSATEHLAEASEGGTDVPDADASSHDEPDAHPYRMTDPPASALVGQGDVPDLDLTVGFADNSGDGGEMEGPSADLPGIDQTLVCGKPLLAQTHTPTGRLLASNSAPEWFESRQVIAYEDPAAATAVVDHIVRLVNSCPTEMISLEESSVSERVWQVFGSDEPNAVTFADTPADGLGGSLYRVAQVGRSVLVLVHSGEWSTASVSGGIEGIIDDNVLLRPMLVAAFPS